MYWTGLVITAVDVLIALWLTAAADGTSKRRRSCH
jgi:hypothetical protein